MNTELTLYAPFIKEIKELIYRHQYEAMKKVNIELLTLYWKIGHRTGLKLSNTSKVGANLQSSIA